MMGALWWWEFLLNLVVVVMTVAVVNNLEVLVSTSPDALCKSGHLSLPHLTIMPSTLSLPLSFPPSFPPSFRPSSPPSFPPSSISPADQACNGSI